MKRDDVCGGVTRSHTVDLRYCDIIMVFPWLLTGKTSTQQVVNPVARVCYQDIHHLDNTIRSPARI